MPYYIIEKYPLFLTHKKYNEIREEVSKDKSPLWRTSSMIQGHEEAEEKDNLIYNLLLKKYNEDKNSFIEEFYSFDLFEEEASLNVWDLLYDFSSYYGYSYLKDFRNFSDKLEADYSSELYLYPMGKVFSFNHFVKPAKWWWKYRYKMRGRSVELIIDTQRVIRINGNLKDFTIHFNDSFVNISKNIRVFFNKTPY